VVVVGMQAVVVVELSGTQVGRVVVGPVVPGPPVVVGCGTVELVPQPTW